MKTRRILHRVSTWLLVIVLLVITAIELANKPVKYEILNSYASSEVIYADGNKAQFEGLDFGVVNKGDIVKVTIKLPQNAIFENSVLVFYDYNATTEVWIGDSLLYAYGQDLAEKGWMIGNHDFIIEVPQTAWGNEISIILNTTENHAFSSFTNIKLYPAMNLIQFYTDSDPIGFVVAITLFILGIIGSIGIILGEMRGESLRNALSLSLTILLISLWMISNKGIYNVFGLDSYFWQPLEYMSAYALPTTLLAFYRGMLKENMVWKKVFDIAIKIAIGFFTVTLILNSFNIIHYYDFMGIGSVVLVGSALLMIGYIFSSKHERYTPHILLKAGIYFFIASCIYEVVIRNLYMVIPSVVYHNLPSFISIGIIALLASMAISFTSEQQERVKKLLSAQIKANALSEVIDTTPVGICQLIPDDNLTIVAANDIFYDIMGYKEDKSSRKTLFNQLPDEEKAFLREKIDILLHLDENSGEFEFSRFKAKQKEETILMRYFYDRNNSGNVTISLIDISERKRIEEELRIHSEEYRLAVEASDHYYFNFDASSKTCTHLFDSEEMFGVSEKVGNIPDSLVDLGICASESVEEYKKAFDMFYKGVPQGEFCLHLRNIRTNIYRWYLGSYRTVFDTKGKPFHAVVAFKDITEQREKELAYNIHKQQIESHSEDEINYFELNLTTGMCNYCFGLQAKDANEVCSSKWDDMIKYSTDKYVQTDYQKSIIAFLKTTYLLEIYEKGITEATREYRGYMPDGKIHWLQVSINLTSDNQTREVRAFCVVEDIEKEKAIELERQAEKQRSHYYEDAYDKLASSIMYGVCKYSADENLTIIFANDIFYQMHGYASQEEAVAAGFTSILFATPPFGQEMVKAAHREYTEGKAGELFETEYPTIDANGKRIWILCRGVYSSKEGIFNASVLNITDRKNAEEQLRVSEERYRLALSQSGKVFFFFDVPSRTMFLSDELAQTFGLPTEVDNMPDNFISQGLVEPQSIEKYRNFYKEIYDGKPKGKAIISCHMRNTPDQVLWYEIAFTTVFNARGVPISSIITYEDLQNERKNMIASAWKQVNLLSMPASKYVIAEYNLTQGNLVSQVGELFAKMPNFINNFDEINGFVCDHFIYEEDIENYKKFLDRNRLIAMFEKGKNEDTIEYRSLQSGSDPRWTSTSIQMIRDPYSDDILAQMLFVDINTEKSGQIEMSHNIEELKKELENSRIKVMIHQMQPHFLYNALSAIQTIVKVDPDYAYNLIYDFTVQLRASIKALSSDAPIPFADELKNIKAYLNIEQMRFGDSLKVKYEIDCDSFSVVPLSIQPLAENAARHGVYPKGDEGGTVVVRTYETAMNYIVEVEDDGTGFDVNYVLENGGDSVGLKNLIFRLKSLMNADVIINSKIGFGTKVTVKLPKKGE